MLITFSGHDGSGKTFLANSLKECFEKKGKWVILIEYKGYFFIDVLVNFFRKFLIKSNAQEDINFLNTSEKKICYKIWPFLVFSLDWIHFILVVFPLSKVGVVITDRYMYDRLIGFYYYKFLDKRAFNLLFNMIPKPKNSFFLYCSPRKAQERETEEKHPMDFYTEMGRIYKLKAQEYNIKFIENEVSKNLLLEQVKDCVKLD